MIRTRNPRRPYHRSRRCRYNVDLCVVAAVLKSTPHAPSLGHGHVMHVMHLNCQYLKRTEALKQNVHC